uniref:Large ribosomal subunit protein P2 n=1 Tax=Caenorhabditis tropicalis TaxID=1561998 RepID=A0A1I7U4V3_9PELO
MRYVGAYLLAVLGGNTDPKADDLKKILTAAGVNADAEGINSVVTALQGKTIQEVIAEGKTKIASVPTGGAPAASSSAPAAAAADSKPAKKEEPKEESDEDMGFGLFD